MTTLALNNVRPYGEDATNILIDVTRGEEMASKASNTPYEGIEFSARVTATWLRGTQTYGAQQD